MNFETNQYYQIDALFEVDNCDFNSYYSKEVRNRPTKGELKKESLGLWRDNLSKGFIIFKTSADLTSDIEASVTGIEEAAINKFLISWMHEVMKKDLFTEKEKRKPITLSEMFDIIKITLF